MTAERRTIRKNKRYKNRERSIRTHKKKKYLDKKKEKTIKKEV